MNDCGERPYQAGTSVRTIDFLGFLNGSNAKGTADDILESFKTIGFVSLVNHGLPQHEVDLMFAWSKRFFALPLESKQLAPHPLSGQHHRGYSSPGRELVSQHVYDQDVLDSLRAKDGEVKESFESGREDDPVMPNIWLPDDVLPGFKEACLHFYWACYELEKNILRALALGFGLPEDYFVNVSKLGDNQLRLLHYPLVPNIDPANGGPSRIGAHSDFATITLLFQDDIGGLEVEDPQSPGSFIGVHPVPNAVVVNAGDFLMRWSNDVIKSTIHRVRSPPNFVGEMAPERYSIPYFCSCDLTTVVDAIPGSWDSNNPKKYEPISAKEYILKRLAALY